MHRIKLFTTVAALSLCITSGLSADTLLLGAKGFAAIWDSFIGRIVEEQYANITPQSSAEAGLGRGILAGPVVGYQMSDAPWSFSAAFMFYGNFTQETDISIPEFSMDETVDQKLRRIDIDLAAGRSFGNYFKLFGGYKYQHFKVSLKTSSFTDSIDASVHMPTVGAGIAFPLSSRLFINAQGGLLYIIPVFEDKTENTFGFNTEAGVSFLLTPSLLLQGGYRFQRYNVKFSDPDAYENQSYHDTFHGLTIGLVYMFQDFKLNPADVSELQ
jgi:opacity protein-like surface antigen